MRFVKTSGLLALLAGLVTSLGAVAQISNADYAAWAKATGFKPGMYEYKMSMEMSGIPGVGTMKMPPSSFKKCVTQKDVDEGRQMMSDPKKWRLQVHHDQLQRQGWQRSVHAGL